MKIRILLAVVLFSTTVFAQVKPKVSSAIIAFEKSDLAMAKKKIDEAQADLEAVDYRLDDAKTLSKFYFYKGEVYLGILYSTDETIKALSEDPLTKCEEGYTQLLQFESTLSKPRYSKQAASKIAYVAAAYTNKGAALADAEDFGGAKDAFIKAYDLKKSDFLGDNASTDTSMLFNAALMSMRAKDFEGAAGIFEQVLEMGYTGITWIGTNAKNGQPVQLRSKADAEKKAGMGLVTDIKQSESVRGSTYISLIQCYIATEDTEKYKATLAKARKEFPNDIDLINLEIQDYLDNKDYDKALSVIDEAIAQSPENPLYYFVKGNLYLNDKKDDEMALAAYAKAIEVDPEYSDAMYMSGLVYFNKANAITEEINDLPSSAVKKYDALKAKQKETFKKSLPYFEKALEMKPEDMDTMKALREVYYKVGDTENFKIINDKMK